MCWNDIPVDIKRSPSVNVFHLKLKTYFFETDYWKQIIDSHNSPI